MTTLRYRQRGATLVVSLIMLLLITLLAASSFTLGKGNLQIVGNMQQRTQAFAAAQGAVAAVISSTQFTTTPTNAIPAAAVPAYCPGGANTTCADVNGDGSADINVTVALICDSIQPILNSQISDNDPNATGCLVQQAPTSGVSGSTTGNSLCANSVWDIQATATDASTSAQSVVNEGVAVEVPSTATCP